MLCCDDRICCAVAEVCDGVVRIGVVVEVVVLKIVVDIRVWLCDLEARAWLYEVVLAVVLVVVGVSCDVYWMRRVASSIPIVLMYFVWGAQ